MTNNAVSPCPPMGEMVNGAPEWARVKAEARREILSAREGQVGGRNKTEASKAFVRRYNAHNGQIGISETTFQIFPAITTATLYRWRKDYKKQGAAGLLDAQRRGKPSPKLTPEMESYIIGLLAQNPDRRAVRVFEYLVDKFSGPRFSLPCCQTVRNFIKKWKIANQPLFAYMQNPERWKGNYQAAFGDSSVKAKHFLHFVEFDGTPADLICSDRHRYKLTAGVDVFSGKAKVLVSSTSNSAATAALFRRIILDWGLFDVAVMDNGKDYTSLHVEAACDSLSITRLYLPFRTPEGKPHVERFFGTMATGLFEELGGFCGHNVAERKAIESRKSVAARLFTPGAVLEVGMTREELQQAIDDWLEKIYHQRPNRETGKSPNQRAGESHKPVKRLPAGQESALDILLCPLGKRTVGKKGLRFENGRYIAPELGPLVGYEIQVRRDLTDIGHLWVFDLSGKFVCTAFDSRLKGITAEEAREAKKLQARETKDRAKALKMQAQTLEPSPMLTLIEKKGRESGQIKSFLRSVEFESDAVREAMRAAGAEKVLPENSETTRLEGEAPAFETALDRYKYICRQAAIRALTKREQSLRVEYERTDEYRIVHNYLKQISGGAV